MPKSLVPSYDSETTSLSELSDENMNRKEVVASKTNSFTKFSSSSSSSSTSSSSSSSSSSTSSSDDSDSSLEQPDNTEVEVAIQKTQEQPVDAHIEELKADANQYTPVRISDARSAESEDEDIIENTPEADGYISHRPAENSAARRTRPTVNPSIVISPVYTDESDFDNDIDDPTYNFEDKFANAANRNQRNFIVPPSSDSTSSDSETVTQQRGRKRKRNPEKWKQNQIKRLRNQGKSYVSMSKARKRIPSRCLKVPCTKKCRFECTDKISTMVRYELFTEFWKLGDINKQRAFVKSCLVDVEPKYKYTNAEKPRRPNQAYYFTVDNSKIRVCKLFFKSTLDISERMIYTTKTKTNDDRYNRVAIYDLEAVLQCPRGDTSAFYYKSKLNSYNLTLTELTNKEEKNNAYDYVHCYFWTESDAKRGAVEIGTCVWDYLKNISDAEGDSERNVTFYSDNCCGQNKNKYIATLYMYAVHFLNINSITHKFLITGHTQNEADSVHSLIEREVKKNLKSGPIYSPDQYITLIKNAKKSRPAINVHELTFESFKDIKRLQEDWGYNFSTNTNGQNVNWNEIKQLKMMKGNPFAFYYKSSYEEDTYREVNVRNKRKKMKPLEEITLTNAYTQKQEISANKKKDLEELITKGLILCQLL